MKPSQYYLGQEIQFFLLRQGAQLESLALQAGMTQESLSNLIHGRRRFKDQTLEKIAATSLFKEGDFTLLRLKALRAMDEYDMSELVCAMLEYIKRGELEQLPDHFFETLAVELRRVGLPPALSGKQQQLLELIDPTQS